MNPEVPQVGLGGRVAVGGKTSIAAQECFGGTEGAAVARPWLDNDGMACFGFSFAYMHKCSTQ